MTVNDRAKADMVELIAARQRAIEAWEKQ